MTGANTLGRLVGGPFDGDEGFMTCQPPAVIWAYRCTEGCRNVPNGIHWVTDLDPDLHDEPEVEPYHWDHLTGGSVHVYVWANLAHEPAGRQRETVTA
jgi:hypothetical protein